MDATVTGEPKGIDSDGLRKPIPPARVKYPLSVLFDGPVVRHEVDEPSLSIIGPSAFGDQQ
jgi:hypothetical protein